MLDKFPTTNGTYILIFHLAEKSRVAVGRLGEFDLDPGWYAYVGSALGPGGLRGRLKHHLTPIKTLHWHVDYLREHVKLREVWYLTSDVHYEHAVVAVIASTADAQIPIPHFGSSDCKCPAHLFYFPAKPDCTELLEQSWGVVKI